MRPTFLCLIIKHVVSSDKNEFLRQKSNKLICLQHITLLHSAFINAPSKLAFIHMHFNILSVFTCAGVKGEESACYDCEWCVCVCVCVCVCALKVSMNVLKPTSLDEKVEGTSIQIPLTSPARVHFHHRLPVSQKYSRKDVLISSQQPFIRSGYSQIKHRHITQANSFLLLHTPDTAEGHLWNEHKIQQLFGADQMSNGVYKVRNDSGKCAHQFEWCLSNSRHSATKPNYQF